MPLSHRKLTCRSPAAVLLLFLFILIARLALGASTVNAQTLHRFQVSGEEVTALK
jgi:hypothetical protein